MPPDAPVRDCDGLPVWRVRVATVNEMTCTVCGETTTIGYCARCGTDTDCNPHTPLVRTLDYLRPGEYEAR
jgi:hypothetical protein